MNQGVVMGFQKLRRELNGESGRKEAPSAEQLRDQAQKRLDELAANPLPAPAISPALADRLGLSGSGE